MSQDVPSSWPLHMEKGSEKSLVLMRMAKIGAKPTPVYFCRVGCFRAEYVLVFLHKKLV